MECVGQVCSYVKSNCLGLVLLLQIFWCSKAIRAPGKRGVTCPGVPNATGQAVSLPGGLLRPSHVQPALLQRVLCVHDERDVLRQGPRGSRADGPRDPRDLVSCQASGRMDCSSCHPGVSRSLRRPWLPLGLEVYYKSQFTSNH